MVGKSPTASGQEAAADEKEKDSKAKPRTNKKKNRNENSVKKQGRTSNDAITGTIDATGGNDHSEGSPPKSESQLAHNQQQERAKCDIAGVRYSWIVNEFILSCGGRRAFKGLTTDDVLKKHTKELTKPLGISYCDLLKHQGRHDAVKEKADAFISHWFGYPFLDAVDAIGCSLSKNGGSLDSYIWWDMFSINQHGPSNWSFEWLSTTFKGSVGEIGKIIVVMSPWEDPKPFARGWCVFEVCSAIATNSKFEIALSQRDERQFVEDIKRNGHDSVNKMLAEVSAEKSKCSVESERERMFKAIEAEVGFSELNGLLFEKYRSWVIETAVSALNNCNDELERCVISNLVGSLHCQQGNFAAAKPCWADAFEKRKILLGDDHEDTLAAMTNLASVHKSLGDYKEAKKLYEVCLAKQMQELGDRNPSSVMTMGNLANVLMSLGEYKEAVELCEDCLAKQKQELGDKHPHTLTTMNNLANMHRSLGYYKEVVELYEDCLATQKQELGDKHPHTLTTMHNLALLLERLGDYKVAKELHIDCLAKQKQELGDKHPNTLSTMSNLAHVLGSLGNYKEAEDLCDDCLTKQTQALGDEHPDILTTMNSWAHVRFRQGNLGHAEKLYADCLETSQKVLGANHPKTILYKKNLDDVRSRLQNF